MEFTDKKLKILELFGGIGACSKALERIGIDFEIVDYVEIDKYAVKSFNAIHNTNFEPQDITQWDKDIDVDLIMHGSPCQDFSLAGLQAGGDEGSGTRSSLMYETIRIVKKLKPKYVIWENVKNLLSKKHRHNFDAYLEIMESLGYKNYYQVLNAKDYGIPQNRERVFTISILGDDNYKFPVGEENANRIKRLFNFSARQDCRVVYDKEGLSPTLVAGMGEGGGKVPMLIEKTFEFPQKQELKLKLKDMLEDKVDEKYYLSDELIKNVKYHEDTKINEVVRKYGVFDDNKSKHQAGSVYDENGLSPTLDTMQGGWRQPCIEIKNATKKGYQEATDGDSVNLAYPKSKTRRGRVGHQVSQTIQCNDMIGVVENKPKVIGGFGKVGSTNQYHLQNRIYDNNVGISICTTCNPNYIDNNLRIRKLTPKECWRLMGFDDSDFEKAEKVNSNTQLYKQARKLNLCTSFRKDFLSIIFKIKEKNMSKKMLPNDEKLIELYIKQKKSCKEICRIYGLSENSSSNLGIRLKKLGVEIRKDAGINHHNWKGGRIIKGDGYVGIWKPDHKKSDNQGYVYEHTLIVENQIKRQLNKDEEIHHINLDKTDNNIDNLCLCTHKTHIKIHRSIEKLIPILLKQNIIYFDRENKEYKTSRK